MQTLPPNLIVAGLGPFAELCGLAVLVALFTLLRGQADRRPYFKSWEESWVMLAVAMVGGVIYQRLTDPSSVLYPGGPITTWMFELGYLGFKLLALALLLFGTRLFVNGARERRYVKAAMPIGFALSLVPVTSSAPLGALALAHGPFSIAVYAYGAWLFATLPPSRRSTGSRIATLVLVALGGLWTGLVAFHLLALRTAAVVAQPWFVRLDRYGFFVDATLQLGLAYAMVRLLLEDSRRETNDTRAQVAILHDRQRLADVYDGQTGLLNRRAFESAVGLDFAKASFGSVALVQLTNIESIADAHGGSVGQTMLKHFAAVLDSAVRTHDRVYRWDEREFLVVLPRAVPAVALARMQYLAARAARLSIAGVQEAIHAEAAVTVRPFSGAEDLADAVAQVSIRDHAEAASAAVR